MFSSEQIITYFKEVARSIKFQLSATITFGAALILVWLKENNELKIFLTILFLFPLCMFVISIIEKIALIVNAKVKKCYAWKNLTPEEMEFISYYIKNNSKTRYMVCFNGTYRDSGIINPLIHKGILYIASRTSEFRGNDWMSKEQHFPINIHDDAFLYFKNKFNV